MTATRQPAQAGRRAPGRARRPGDTPTRRGRTAALWPRTLPRPDRRSCRRRARRRPRRCHPRGGRSSPGRDTERPDSAPVQRSHIGCAATPATPGPAPRAITRSRSSQDSCPTCSPAVANHHRPGRLRCPRNDANPRTAATRSNATFQQPPSGSRRGVPSVPANSTSTSAAAPAYRHPIAEPAPATRHQAPHDRLRSPWCLKLSGSAPPNASGALAMPQLLGQGHRPSLRCFVSDLDRPFCHPCPMTLIRVTRSAPSDDHGQFRCL